ncbi:hypothetical protein QUB24_21855 [Microcoleus sp. B9-D4]
MYIVYWLRSSKSQWQICHWLMFVTDYTIPTGDQVAIETYTQITYFCHCEARSNLKTLGTP